MTLELDEAELALLEGIKGQLEEMKSVSPEWIREISAYVERVDRLQDALVNRLLEKVYPLQGQLELDLGENDGTPLG